MKKVDVVIGANYGDEGKGNITNYLATSDSAVVRFNGGAQAGHTVEHHGIRHVFHHFGSGTLKGAATVLGPQFAVDPVAFFREAAELSHKIDHGLIVMASPSCPIVTPFDILINQALERKRDGNRHGSCGMGFGEAIRRNANGFRFKLRDTWNAKRLCDDIRDNYYLSRIKNLNLTIDEADLDRMLEVFHEELISFKKHVKFTTFEEIEDEFNNIVFEGAQGLCLDQNSKDFPHVTYSNTGLDNVLDLLKTDKHILNIHYATRTYLTRHGAGKLINEHDKPEGVVDGTNIHNEFQGSLRFAPLNLDRMKADISNDLSKIHEAFDYNVDLMITCCDQVSADYEKIADHLGINGFDTCWSVAGDWAGAESLI